MSVRVGVIGVGMIGADHVRRISSALAGGDVVAVTDADLGRAQAVAAGVPGTRVHASGEALVADDAVDVVLVASWGPTHERYVLASIRAGKPVFCEKPLATTQDACRRIVDAETGTGGRLVQVGFMRRYDPAYRALKDSLDHGSIGAALMLHCAHRNASVPSSYTEDMMVNDSGVHEMDATRWLLGEEIVGVRALDGRRSTRAPEGVRDPLLLILDSASGVLVDIEVSVSAGYGYDVRCEVVGERGTASLGDEGAVRIARDGHRGSPVPQGWQDRFARAYDIELQAWLDAAAAGRCTGPSSWDGLAAAAIADSALEARRTGERVPVDLPDRPPFYDT